MRFACHTRQLNGAVLWMRPQKPRPRVTIKIPLSHRPFVRSIGKNLAALRWCHHHGTMWAKYSLKGRNVKQKINKWQTNNQTNTPQRPKLGRHPIAGWGSATKRPMKSTTVINISVVARPTRENFAQWRIVLFTISYDHKVLRINLTAFYDKQIEGGGSTYYLF